jgi:hypothetical protein
MSSKKASSARHALAYALNRLSKFILNNCFSQQGLLLATPEHAEVERPQVRRAANFRSGG